MNFNNTSHCSPLIILSLNTNWDRPVVHNGTTIVISGNVTCQVTGNATTFKCASRSNSVCLSTRHYTAWLQSTSSRCVYQSRRPRQDHRCAQRQGATSSYALGSSSASASSHSPVRRLGTVCLTLCEVLNLSTLSKDDLNPFYFLSHTLAFHSQLLHVLPLPRINLCNTPL